MLRYVAFLVLGTAFVAGIATTVETHRLFGGLRDQLTNTAVNYVDGHWPTSIPPALAASVSH